MKRLLSFIIVLAIIGAAVFGVKQYFSPKEPVSLSAHGIGSQFDPIYVTAHRGGNTEAPENSLPSFRSAVQKNFYAAECDILRTKDGKWVITHDDSVINHFFGTGKVSEMTFDEVRKLKYSFDTAFWEYQDEKIPSLEEYLDVLAGSNTRPEIEIKSKTTEGLEDVLSALRARSLTKQAIIISFHYECLERIHELDKSIELWYLMDDITDDGIDKALKIGCKAISANYKNTGAEDVAMVLDSGLKLVVWTVDSPETVSTFYNMGVRYFVTNKLGI
ncbi:MAG: hypothetical protein IJM02_06120 [Clostridia bacterium]|nr:hypothetical protein [Clostridia bacterium]